MHASDTLKGFKNLSLSPNDTTDKDATTSDSSQLNPPKAYWRIILSEETFLWKKVMMHKGYVTYGLGSKDIMMIWISRR